MNSVPVEMLEITKGLTNAISTQAEAFRPIVFVNTSREIPSRNADRRSSQRGVSNGSNKIK
jgi:hypothetical protein